MVDVSLLMKLKGLAIDQIERAYGAEYANVQPHSGSQANQQFTSQC